MHERAAKLLLERKEVNPDIRDEYSQMLLLLAAKRGYNLGACEVATWATRSEP